MQSFVLSLKGVKGEVTVNGKERRLDSFRRVSCYIQQDDRLQPLLTVSENMQIAANLKLPMDKPQKYKDAIVSRPKRLRNVNTIGDE